MNSCGGWGCRRGLAVCLRGWLFWAVPNGFVASSVIPSGIRYNHRISQMEGTHRAVMDAELDEKSHVLP